ncbi:MAG: XdhC family protein [Planctomycetota bacterium]|jgi:xanthine dehydrogenase accessory factor|nr:XdhC family protein [Planctomycetota bacterium]
MTDNMLSAAEDDAVFDHMRRWRAEGRRIVLASVIRAWNSSPRPVGSHLAVADDGRFAGSVSGGCVEGVVIGAAKQVLEDGVPRTLDFGISSELAWENGLACGGRIQVFVARMPFDLLDRLLDCRSRRLPVLTVTRMRDGVSALLDETGMAGNLPLAPDRMEWARAFLSREDSFVADWHGEAYFARFYPVPVHLVIIGAVHLAQTLARMAILAGFEVYVIDPRRAFATKERFPDVDLICEWPDEALRKFPPDRRTAMVAVSHDSKLDDPALVSALAGGCFYVGALGSSRTHAARIERLSSMGFEKHARRIHGPVGLDLGGRGVAEMAIAILAQIIQQLHSGAKA